MRSIAHKLNLLTRAWNDDFLESPFLWKALNTSPELTTNYFGDILVYLHDTLEQVDAGHFTGNRDGYVFKTMGLLQTVYVHQDLIDELLHIFLLPQSSGRNKERLRQLRNELIGHPVSRERGKLRSTAIFRFDDPKEQIGYILYARHNDYRPQRRGYSIALLIEEHEAYLTEHVDQVLRHVQQLYGPYRDELLRIQKKVAKGHSLRDIIRWLADVYPAVFHNQYIFNPDRLQNYLYRNEEHLRYAHAITLFRAELASFFRERLADIEAFLALDIAGIRAAESPIPPDIVVKVVFSDEAKLPEAKKRDYGYELSKLHERQPVCSIDYFQRLFPDQPAIQAELTHMKDHYDDDTEYYAGYHYLKHLITEATIVP